LEPDDVEELIESMDRNYLGWSSTMGPVIMGNADRPELSQELTNSFCRTNPTIAREFARVTFLSDNRADLPRLTTPALILQCTQDVIAPVEVGRYLHQQLPGSQLEMIETSGHCPHLSAPDATEAAIRRFL
jgi:sigma-B regulation protein RsbQ